MKYPSIAILDLIGLVYDGSTLSKKGLGGSESAVILMSRELANIGFDVTVFNACNVDDAKPGVYDGVTYRPIESLTSYEKYDIMVVSRTVVPFVPENQYKNLMVQPDTHVSCLRVSARMQSTRYFGCMIHSVMETMLLKVL